MKVLIFSDTHLTKKIDKRKYDFLFRLIDSSDQVIINGDFWDCWFTDFNDFINSEWCKLFPLLKKKNTIYIYGNHDPKEKCDSRVNLFSTKASEKYILNFSNQIYTIEHGHKILEGKRSKSLEIYSSFLDKIRNNRFKTMIYMVLHILEYLGYKCIGIKLMTQSKIAKNNNEIMKESDYKGMLICGDTHYAEIDRSELFANSGAINYGFASYILISNKDIRLHKEDY